MGNFLCRIGVGFLSLFSVSLFLSEDLFLVWLLMELSSVSVVPCFFYSKRWAYLPLFSYVLASSFSSVLIVGGCLFEESLFLCYVGLLVKFGVFPFMGWVYSVFVGSNWLVIWALSTLLKLSFLALFFVFGLSSCSYYFVSGLCGLTLFLLCFLFWLYTFSWKHYWCHVALSSSAVLFVAAGSSLPLSSLIFIFLVYFIWCTVSIYFVSLSSFWGKFGSVFFFFAVGLLVSFPVSLGVFYKFCVGLHVFSCGWWFLLLWVLCSLSEQFYLLKLLFSISPCFKDWGAEGLI